MGGRRGTNKEEIEICTCRKKGKENEK